MSPGRVAPVVTFVVPIVEFPGPEARGSSRVDPAEARLGTLSGALLATWAAMAGARALAAAALRAAAAAPHRAGEPQPPHGSPTEWQDATFAVSRANARLDVLHARVRRVAPPDGQGGEPSAAPARPELPPALVPAGLRLDEIHTWLALTDRTVRRAETELARQVASLCAAASEDDRPTATARRLWARRERALTDYAEARTEREAADALPPYTSPLPVAPALTAALAAELGEELLAGLDPAVPVAACARLQEGLGRAVELASHRPADALPLLHAARERAYAANWRAAGRRETAEWAAQQLRVLRQPRSTSGPAPEAALTALERAVEHGDPVDPRLRADISGQVAARRTALERLYVAELARRGGPGSRPPSTDGGAS
ncbi:hypothetical protein [Streptomyces hainanensis]|uniref:Uncharacterized protein n=1 Tax=Streptomyces hainanensis TaxID=402648 RepID=A0A4R4TIC8_9ACTN|nr:hypothetical protein [Streptomyces hainanensis]TDC74059.1 hypothetical protein E1283_17105 [Streptomyces hainanensis]